MRLNPRQQLIDEMRAHLERDSFPRLTILWVLFVAGCIAFLTSAFALWSGLTSMTSRYALAAISGYGGFLVMLRAWLEYRQGMWDIGDAWHRTANLTPDPLEYSSVTARTTIEPPTFALDLDDLWWLLVLIAAVLGALATIAFVVYDAPQLLAEVALDAGLVSAVYHRIRHEPAQHWSRTALRRTWLPAALLTTFVSVAGYAMEHLVPHAHSIGDVLRVVL